MKLFDENISDLKFSDLTESGQNAVMLIVGLVAVVIAYLIP